MVKTANVVFSLFLHRDSVNLPETKLTFKIKITICTQNPLCNVMLLSNMCFLLSMHLYGLCTGIQYCYINAKSMTIQKLRPCLFWTIVLRRRGVLNMLRSLFISVARMLSTHCACERYTRFLDDAKKVRFLKRYA